MEEEKPSLAVPGWVLPVVGTAAFTVFISFAGAAFTVWNSSALHDATLASHAKQMDRFRDDIVRIEAKVDRSDKEAGHFQGVIMDKVDTLLETDRFRKSR